MMAEEGSDHIETRLYDSSLYLKTSESIAEYLRVVAEFSDPSLLAYAAGVVARANAMLQKS